VTTVFIRNKANSKCLSTFLNLQVCSMAQNKVTSDGDIVEVLGSVGGNFLEIVPSDSDSNIGCNQESYESGTSEGEQSDSQLTTVLSGWCDMKWQ
jgi:hypothetical protein